MSDLNVMNNKQGISMIRSILAATLLLSALSIGVNISAEEMVQAEAPEIVNPNQDLLDLGQTILDDIQQQIKEIASLNQQFDIAAGDHKIALGLELQSKTSNLLDKLFKLANNLEEQEQLDLEISELRGTVVSYLNQSSIGIDRRLDFALEHYIANRSMTTENKGFELIEFEQAMAEDLKWIDKLFKNKVRSIAEMKRLDVNTMNHEENLSNRLVPFADSLSGQIRLLLKEKETIEVSSADESPSSELRYQLLAFETREKSVLGALSFIVILLDENNIDSTPYRQLLLETGQVSTDLFNPKIVLIILENELIELVETIRSSSDTFLTKAFIIILILFTFRLLAKFTSVVIQRSFKSRKVEISRLMQEMLLAFSSKGIMLLGYIIALSQLGVEITALLTGLGIAGFIVGFALQDTLGNFAAGIMILAYRPFDVDDIVEAGGVIGSVSKMSLVSTTILTFDNQTLIIPNNRIWGDVIKNITLQRQRRIDMEFRISYDEDINKVNSVINNVIENNDKILKNPTPTVELDQLTPSAMIFVVRPWVNRGDYWPVKWELLKTIKEALDQENIKIPVIHQSVAITE